MKAGTINKTLLLIPPKKEKKLMYMPGQIYKAISNFQKYMQEK